MRHLWPIKRKLALKEKRFTLNSRGIALLLVLSSLMIISTLVINFATSSNVNFNIAMNERDRLQAYYMAQSALYFSKLMIQYDKEAKKMIADAAKRLNRNIQVKPLYKMLPINSELLRGLAKTPGIGEGAENAAEEPNVDAKTLAAVKEKSNSFNDKVAKEFLDFEGNFSADIDSEEGKFPLNAFYTLTPAQPEYDRLKYVLIFLLQEKPFEPFFKDKTRESIDLATKIIDFIDKNDSVNDFGGGERGSEASTYTGTTIRPKNAKLLDVEELIFVPGMKEDLLQELKKNVTVYRDTDKINACVASDELLQAMIVAYTQKRDDMEPLRMDNAERLKNAVTAVQGKCPDTAAMGQTLNETLGATAPNTQNNGSTVPPAGGAQSQPSAATTAAGFSSMLTDQETIFTVHAKGELGNARVKIVEVLNASGNNPAQWKELFWRVE